jgi:NTP pyrophosphatase (non-canonical NTP hydrolase)
MVIIIKGVERDRRRNSLRDIAGQADLRYDDLTLGGAQHLMESIYALRNHERFGRSSGGGLYRMWLQVVKHGCQMAKAVRKERFDLLLDELPQAFCWYSGFCSLLDIKLDDIVWQFFPYVCPTCYKERCVCGTEKDHRPRKRQKDPKLLAKFRRLNAKRRPSTLNDYVKMFGKIYGAHADSVNMQGIFLHFTEELGEVAEEIDQSRRSVRKEGISYALRGELADVFSWIAKLCWKANSYSVGLLKSPASTDQISLAALIRARYGNGCPDCGRRTCTAQCSGWIR